MVSAWYVYGVITTDMAQTQEKTHKIRSIRIPKQTDKRLTERAKSQGRSVNSQIVFELDQK